FHQSYAYEEFVEGIRPVMTEGDEEDGDVRYRCEPGSFKSIALRAAAEGVQLREFAEEADPGAAASELTQDQRIDLFKDFLVRGERSEVTLNYEDAPDYVLVIDEINRGNISKILGELITLLEPSKRLTEKDQLIGKLPYSKERFAVPPNLHIIGTMNTADRSIALMDVALRRRFSFEEMLPDWRVIRDSLQASLPGEVYGGKDKFINLVIAVFENINARIRFLYDDDHQLGHSYFMGLTGYKKLREAFLESVIPLLQEYFYGSWERVCLALGCPYAEYGEPGRSDGHAMDVDGYRAPLVETSSLLEKGLLGMDHDDFEDQQSYAIAADFLEGTLEPADLETYFECILSGEYLANYNKRVYSGEAN
ncbi:MAG: McrB family protein, partial [Persicimonas sp.]